MRGGYSKAAKKQVLDIFSNFVKILLKTVDL